VECQANTDNQTITNVLSRYMSESVGTILLNYVYIIWLKIKKVRLTEFVANSRNDVYRLQVCQLKEKLHGNLVILKMI